MNDMKGRKRFVNILSMAVILIGIGSIGLSEAYGASEAGSPPPKWGSDTVPHAIIKTKFGEMEIRFFPEKAPGHVNNFLKLAKEGFYDGTLFHRVIPGFMIQGGDPNTKDPAREQMYGMGGPGYSVDAEFNDVPHKRGIISMARAQDPNSAGSQFFVVVEDSHFLDGKYTVFGEVIRGMSVADTIVHQPRGFRDLPNERIEMTVEVLE